MPATKDDVENYKLIKLDENSEEMKYLHSKREESWWIYSKKIRNEEALEIPSYQDFAKTY